jgi:3-deoxy-D-manno-octulosonic-acid transferase
MLRVLYTLLLRLLLPIAGLLFWWRGRRDPAHRVNLRERLGHGRQRQGPQPVWIHAVSVGEVQAAAGLIALLRERDPWRPVLLTMATATGRQRAQALYRDPLVELRFAPFDLPGAARRFLVRERPVVAIFLETELWPNLLACCARRHVPVALVSARLSERSLHRYRSFARRLMRRTLRTLAVIAAQSDADAARFVALGADPAQVHVAGNVKFDFTLPPDTGARSATLRERWIGGRRAWVAGSTHAGEEQQLLQAQRRLEGVWPGVGSRGAAPLLVLVPRHPERFAQVAQWLQREGVRFARRSDPAAQVDAAMQVLLVDTLGELLPFYACGEVAFVGGSLVPIGGHNLLEPAVLGLPVLSGPHNFNSPEAAARLVDCGALEIVRDAAGLASAVLRLLTDEQEAGRRGEAGRTEVLENRGAAARSLTLLGAVLPPVA